jgi:serine O-acetyltransferase
MTFQELRSFWKADFYRHTGKSGWGDLLVHLVLSDGDERFSDGVKYTFYLRLCRYLHRRRARIVFWPLYLVCRSIFTHYKYKFGVSIPHATLIGRGLYIGHVRNIVVSDRVVIGDNCNISHGVSIGQANRGPRKGTAVIGHNVYIGPGAKIVGAVRVGDYAAIGANCVVTDDVPDHAVVVGVPSRVISFEGSAGYVNRTDYEESEERAGITETAGDQQAEVLQRDRKVPAAAVGRRYPATVVRSAQDE